MSPVVEARIVELRRAHAGHGPRTLRHLLEREGVNPLPGRSSIYRCLVRHGLITPQARRRRREDYRRWERSRSMELWQMDIMGGVRLEDGRQLAIVTGLDDHSRFCVCAHLVARATARPVCEALALALRRYGVPDQILSDNGKVFTGRFGPGTGEVLFDRMCRENGIRHLLTAPRSPTTTGKVERFHKTVRSEFLSARVFASPEEAQEELDAWVVRYNRERPHQGIGMVPPFERFRLALLAPLEPEKPAPVRTNAEERQERHFTRRVGKNGKISLATFAYHVGCYLAAETVEVLLTDEGLVQVFHRGVLVATHARRHPVEAEPLLWHRRPHALPVRPQTVGRPVLRKVDKSGTVSFAGTGYRVGNGYRLKEVEVRVVGDTVQISAEGRIIRTHFARHDPAKEHGAFATPQGRPHRKNAAC
jgi:transposase InsO family protein